MLTARNRTAVIDQLLATSNLLSPAPVIVYFYCDYSDRRTLEALGIFGNFIKQLLSKTGMSDEVQSKLADAYKNGTRTPDTDELLEILFLILKPLKSVFFVLDGIDECGGSDRGELLAGIQSIAKLSPPVVKLFLASRAEVDFQRAFSSFMHLPISTSDVTPDIVSFVKDIVKAKVDSRELMVKDPLLEKEIVDALVKGAQGM